MACSVLAFQSVTMSAEARNPTEVIAESASRSLCDVFIGMVWFWFGVKPDDLSDRPGSNLSKMQLTGICVWFLFVVFSAFATALLRRKPAASSDTSCVKGGYPFFHGCPSRAIGAGLTKLNSKSETGN